jgi:hypothetical protein
VQGGECECEEVSVSARKRVGVRVLQGGEWEWKVLAVSRFTPSQSSVIYAVSYVR